MFCKAKSAHKKTFFLPGNFRPLTNKNVLIWGHFIPSLFPKDSESLKILDIRLWEVGAKRCLNGTSKVNRQTDRRTHRETDISTFRKHRPRGPSLWKHVGPLPSKKKLLNPLQQKNWLLNKKYPHRSRDSVSPVCRIFFVKSSTIPSINT